MTKRYKGSRPKKMEMLYIIFISLKTKKVNPSWKKLLYIETERVKREIDYKIDSFQYTGGLNHLFRQIIFSI